ncbi:hypothetical protein [Desulfovibrio ferrophilus]|uniref:Alpha-1,6-glucosidase, pullulanase-type n=1 Tax=Desulfovibrio ferrophilus TaxID=241368 RepID=A0A2Z6AVR4_9BACT|nr:hypothetical protein [Desulfovibrio ferrophilus]BBD07265.1 alpha-1,6-glucosidase, pullulanase-type [Desulfovibrio ferrophilus]
MNVTYKPILFDEGTARAIPHSFFNELFDGRAAFPMHAGKSLNCALAFIRGPEQDIYTLTGLQCMRINFNERGTPATWHMSILPLANPCQLVEGNTPTPSGAKIRREPHFWFPDTGDLRLITQTLINQYAPRKKRFILHARLHPTPSVLPPSIAPQYTMQLRAAH